MVRNRAKRLLRAAAQSLYNRIHPGWDLVIIAREPMKNSNLHETSPAMELLLKRARLLKEVEASH